MSEHKPMSEKHLAAIAARPMGMEAELVTEIRELRETLAWYGDEKNYQDSSGRRIWDDAPAAPICDDYGKRALERLKEPVENLTAAEKLKRMREGYVRTLVLLVEADRQYEGDNDEKSHELLVLAIRQAKEDLE